MRIVSSEFPAPSRRLDGSRGVFLEARRSPSSQFEVMPPSTSFFAKGRRANSLCNCHHDDHPIWVCSVSFAPLAAVSIKFASHAAAGLFFLSHRYPKHLRGLYAYAAQVAWSKSHQMHPMWTMQKNSFSRALFFENRILVQRNYLSYHLCHFVPFFGQPKTKKTIISVEHDAFSAEINQ